MTLAEIQAVLRDVRFPLYVFHAEACGDRYWLQATFFAPCSETGETKRQHTRKWYVSNQATVSEVVQTALKCTLASVEHEAREAFEYRGRPIFGPHFDVDQLVALFDAGDPLARRVPHDTPSAPGSVDCGECPCISTGCQAGHCLKARA